MPKTWHEKLVSTRPPKVEVLAKPMLGAPAGARMYIATPRLVQDYIKAIPFGETRAAEDLRCFFAKKNRADATCPLTTGIFLRIVAEDALEEIRHGVPVEDVAPFWRIVSPHSRLAKRLSCGVGFVEERRKAEGIDDPVQPPLRRS